MKLFLSAFLCLVSRYLVGWYSTTKVGEEVTFDVTLLDYLRDYEQLRGTKYMCREGGCGACIVNVEQNESKIYAVNACMLSITSCHGLKITTIESVGNRNIGYHKLQKTLAEHNGSQCGHCSPGWVMSMRSLLNNKPDITMLELEKSLSSNICRCTGYRPILEAYKTFAHDAPDRTILDIEDLHICKKNGKICRKKQDSESNNWCFVDKDDVFETDLIEMVLKDGKRWYKVNDVKDIFNILEQESGNNYMLVAGNTAKGAYPVIDVPKILIDISNVNELKGYELDQNLIVGASNTLTELLDIFDEVGDKEGFGYLVTLKEHLNKVAHVVIRNLATIAGNLMIKHMYNIFPSDIYLLLSTVGAQVTLVNESGKNTTVTMSEFLKTNMQGTVILNIMLPPLSCHNFIKTYKIMPRSTSAHAILNAGFLYQLSKTNVVKRARIVFGGLSSTFNRAYKTEQYLVGKDLFTNETLKEALKILEGEMVVEENPPEPSVEYRRKTALALFYKCLLSLCPDNQIDPCFRSGAFILHDNRPVSQSTQVYETEPSRYPINKPIVKTDSLIQCAGEASYTNDLHSLPHEVFAAFVLSTVACGEIVHIDTSKAFELPGVVAFYTAKDIPGKNSFILNDGTLYVSDEEVLCSGTVAYFNQPIGVIVAETQHIAEKAAKLVVAQYRNVKKPVIDVKIAKTDPKRVTFFKGQDATSNSTDAIVKVIKGYNAIEGQYHFPLENIACVIHPIEEGLRVYDSTHYVNCDHVMLSKALNIDQSCIDVHVRRIGGSYGLKITCNTQSTIACGLVVQKLGRPCRFIRPLTDTMRAVGKRFPCTTDFEIGVSSNGMIQYMNYNMYEDNGYINNEQVNVLITESYYSCYDRSRWNFKNYDVITDTPKNTWMRAPGTLESVSHIELIMERIAYELGLDPMEVRLNNFDKDKYGDIIEMYNTLKDQADYDERRKAVYKFNEENRWKKRGLRFSIMRWSGAPLAYYYITVSICHGDGTVIILHGGVEMGQGINTRVIQIAAHFFNIPVEKIQVKGLINYATPNNLWTAGSITNQCLGLGVRRCCEELLVRIKPIKDKNPEASWEKVIEEAFKAQIDLQARSFFNSKDAEMFMYDVFGVGLSDVEIDVLTGEWEVRRVDLLQDCGKSVNPELDIGQVEGAFIMGMGYFTTEKLIYDPKTGELLTNRTWNYYVPMCTDIPQDFRVYLRKNSYSYEAIEGSKAVSEPPICLAISVAFAIREAISEARCNSGILRNKWFQIDGPSTVDVIALSTATKAEDFLFKK